MATQKYNNTVYTRTHLSKSFSCHASMVTYPVNQHWDTCVLLRCYESVQENLPSAGKSSWGRISNTQEVVPCLTGVGTQSPTWTFTHCVRHGQLAFASPTNANTQRHRDMKTSYRVIYTQKLHSGTSTASIVS